MTKWVYSFGDGKAEGDASMRNLLGGKGANLAEMSKIGIPVPLGLTITTEVCTYYYKNDCSYPKELEAELEQAIKNIEDNLGKKFGDKENPLLVSVRSGARASMPGMMDTVLNLGINAEIADSIAKKTGNARFAYDSYRRFIQMYADVVLNVDHFEFEQILADKKRVKSVTEDIDLKAEDLKELAEEFKEKVEEITGNVFPEDAKEQLWGAISAVFDSWMTDRAITYRKLNEIPQEWGTAVNVQSMVFGNMGDDCATGVAFTRDPSTGEKLFYGEYLINAQGEDVVAGIRTPCPITLDLKNKQNSELLAMEEALPNLYQELVVLYKKLEAHYCDMQDIEFTIENNKLWILQTRSGKRTAKASIKIASDMLKEGLISEEEALLRIDPLAIDQLLHPTLDPNDKKEVITKGLPASPGAAVGKIVFSAEDAEHFKLKKEDVILVRIETSPEDISGMHASQGILTARGGMTSHAAVVARGMGKPCVSGAGDLKIDQKSKTLQIKDFTFKEGDYLTINGATGEVMPGKVKTIEANLSDDFNQIMILADKYRRLQIRTNAETPVDCAKAIKFGAEGIGLCRTEHMFFEGDRIVAVREMILANNLEGRKHALAKLLPMQIKDFTQIFAIMENKAVNIRLLDPPLHEFLPHTESEIAEVARVSGMEESKLKDRMKLLSESNPMLGHRGCRLGITYPEIYEMQARAIFVAAITSKTKANIEIMVPLIFSARELKILKEIILNVAKEVLTEYKAELNFKIGTMIELPRAALRAGEIAEEAEYFSFGTNDLTQTTYGMSRDDSSSFISEYIEKKIIEQDPFVRLDEDGVGELLKIAAERGRKTRSNIKLGICGEHGGDPKSIELCDKLGFDYVSCSPYRVPIARLAASISAIKNKKLN
ncbi:MAG: pyruvate, phosphate dikinase [Alphaproteobacteria bacterium]|jgi:pyruvate, orthophosphate dikinase|nr:pyruvate, phosphate dikinase [Alphaproteobacteria bacterium]